MDARGSRSSSATAAAVVALALVSLTIFAEGIKFNRLEDPDVKDFRRQPSSHAPVFAEAVENFTKTGTFDRLETSARTGGFIGAAIFDIDNDGDLDIFVPTGPGQEHALFVNTLIPEGKFGMSLACGNRSCASAFGLAFRELDGNGLCTGDIDNDGDQDLVILNFDAPWQLLRNDLGVFTELALEPQNITAGYAPISCTFGDVNNDGLIDLVITRGGDFPLSRAIMGALSGSITDAYFSNMPNRLLMNKGPEAALHFVDETYDRGFEMTTLNNLTQTCALVDYDKDGDLDYFAFDDRGIAMPPHNDRGRIHLWQNNGSGVFEFVHKEESRLFSPGSNMGAIFADFNCDGNLDYFTTRAGSVQGSFSGRMDNAPIDFLFQVFEDESTLIGFGSDNGTFQQSSVMDSSGTNLYPPFGWGVLAEDFDNDGDADVTYFGGMYFNNIVTLTPEVMLENTGCDGSFKRVIAFEGQEFERYIMGGLAAGDLNDDGFMDFAGVAGYVVPDNATLTLLKEVEPEFIRERLEGSSFWDDITTYFLFVAPDGTIRWGGPVDDEGNPVLLEDGLVAVEVNEATDNNWVKIKLRGSIGDVEGAEVNRDGIGAVISFTPTGGKTSTVPVTGGIFQASSDKTKIFGLGSQTEGKLVVRWPGNTVNVLKVFAGERVVMPEIPCSVTNFDGDEGRFMECLADSLAALMQQGIVDAQMHDRLFTSMVDAYNAPDL